LRHGAPDGSMPTMRDKILDILLVAAALVLGALIMLIAIQALGAGFFARDTILIAGAGITTILGAALGASIAVQGAVRAATRQVELQREYAAQDVTSQRLDQQKMAAFRLTMLYQTLLGATQVLQQTDYKPRMAVYDFAFRSAVDPFQREPLDLTLDPKGRLIWRAVQAEIDHLTSRLDTAKASRGTDGISTDPFAPVHDAVTLSAHLKLLRQLWGILSYLRACYAPNGPTLEQTGLVPPPAPES
jgi:hypothetical protein